MCKLSDLELENWNMTTVFLTHLVVLSARLIYLDFTVENKRLGERIVAMRPYVPTPLSIIDIVNCYVKHYFFDFFSSVFSVDVLDVYITYQQAHVILFSVFI